MGRYPVSQHGGTLSAFRGARYQHGYGLGGFLGGLFRAAVPLLKQGAKTAGRTALKTGAQIASDVLQGHDIKTSVKNRARQGRRELKNKAKQKAMKMIGGGKGRKGRNTKAKQCNRKNITSKAATKRMKGAVLKTPATFPKTAKGLRSHALSKGFIFESK